ncbi:MAG: GntR family transcriptional regulator [Leucobacter sp.]
MTSEPPQGASATTAADQIRAQILEGDLEPGTWLREAPLAESLGISRNTLREAFRTLSNEHIIEQEANRGARVATPSKATIIDLYRVRRLIEVQPLRESFAGHTAGAAMERAVRSAVGARDAVDWQEVARADIEFHQAIVALSDSPRIIEQYRRISGELRLAFWRVREPAQFHYAYVDLNKQILERFLLGDTENAASLLERYLLQSERTLLTAGDAP